MNVFENVRNKANAILSGWIQVLDPKSKWTIEDFPYDTGIDENVTKPHCWKCVSVNQCWFKNEKGKKPEEFDYSKYSLIQIPMAKRGLYHPNCHDKKLPINVPSFKQIMILELRSKFNDFFSRKKKILYSIGYTHQDENEILKYYENEIKTLYRYGNYVIYKHWQFGFQVNFIITIKGKNKFKRESYKFKSGLFVYPKGKLKIVTVFAGRV